MQLVDIGGAHLLGGGATARKCRRHVLNRGALPGSDLGPMDAVLLGQFRQRQLLADRSKRDLGLKLWRMVLVFLHFGSSLSSCDPP